MTSFHSPKTGNKKQNEQNNILKKYFYQSAHFIIIDKAFKCKQQVRRVQAVWEYKLTVQNKSNTELVQNVYCSSTLCLVELGFCAENSGTKNWIK